MNYIRGGLQKNCYSIDEVIKRNCPFCNAAEYSFIHNERGALNIVRCAKCGLIYTNPIVRNPEKNYWGNEKVYLEEAKLIFEGSSGHHRDRNYIEDLRRIEKVKAEGNFLDVGTNMGFFLRHARGKNWNIFGVEPSPSLSEIARKFFGLNVKTAYLEEANFDDSFFDVVTMSDVFEHIYDPKKILLEVKRVLKNNGILFIKVPNGKYCLLKLWLSKLKNGAWGYDIFDSYEHLTHYTHKTLKRMLESCGFKIKEVAIGRPIYSPVWHNFVGHYYQYPSPWMLDAKNHLLRTLFYWISKIEYLLRLGHIGYFASNIIVIAVKN